MPFLSARPQSIALHVGAVKRSLCTQETPPFYRGRQLLFGGDFMVVCCAKGILCRMSIVTSGTALVLYQFHRFVPESSRTLKLLTVTFPGSDRNCRPGGFLGQYARFMGR